MGPIQQWGIDLIVSIQEVHGPVLDGFFRAITAMGTEEFHLLLLPLLFWCINYGLGIRVALLTLLSSYINSGLKDLFQQPRPFYLVPSVKLSEAIGYGLPSGHSQTSVIVWGVIAAWARKTWFRVVAVVLMLLIGFSRVYLGVHFPTDVLAGWAIGAVLLGLYLTAQPSVRLWLTQRELVVRIGLGLAIPLVLYLVYQTDDSLMIAATMAGLGVGLPVTDRYIMFSAGGPWGQRVLRFIVGGVVVLALYLGLRLVVPGEGATLYRAFRALRYVLVGVWVSLGAPWLFRLLRLAPEAE